MNKLRDIIVTALAKDRIAAGRMQDAGYVPCRRPASGIETEGHDPQGRGAEHESPTAEGGDAQ